MGNWLEKFVGATRGRLLALLRRSQQTVNDLAAAVGVSDNAVRTHVAALQRDGIVEEAGLQRSTGGKPAQLYQLTPDAEELFPKAYALVLSEMLSVLEERQGMEAAVTLLREVGRRAAVALAETDDGPEARVRAAAEALRTLGGDVEVLRADSDWELRGYGCPLSGVVTDHPEVCALAQALIEEITDLSVTECCERDSRPQCRFRVAAEPTRRRAGTRRGQRGAR